MSGPPHHTDDSSWPGSGAEAGCGTALGSGEGVGGIRPAMGAVAGILGMFLWPLFKD